jgi:hypothetical protein
MLVQCKLLGCLEVREFDDGRWCEKPFCGLRIIGRTPASMGYEFVVDITEMTKAALRKLS